jgi:hypothetical protein
LGGATHLLKGVIHLKSELHNLQRLSLLTVLAIIGQVILLASAWLLPVVSEYSLVGDNISELVLGRYGFIQTVAFVIAGLGTLGLAFAIRQLTVGSWGSLIGSVFVAINGAGTFLVAFFPTDRIDSPADLESLSTTSMIHIALALVSFLSIIVGMFVLTWTFRRQARWRSFSPWSVLFAAGALSLLFVQTQGPLVGLMQRLLVATIAICLVLVALRVRSIAAPWATSASS